MVVVVKFKLSALIRLGWPLAKRARNLTDLTNNSSHSILPRSLKSAQTHSHLDSARHHYVIKPQSSSWKHFEAKTVIYRQENINQNVHGVKFNLPEKFERSKIIQKWSDVRVHQWSMKLCCNSSFRQPNITYIPSNSICFLSQNSAPYTSIWSVIYSR